LPELASGDVEPIGSGWDSHAFTIDSAWIVRVPHRPETEEALRREARLLSAIETHLPLPVPAPVHVSVDSPVCVVSRRIDGEPATTSPATGRSLGEFLAALHGIATDSVPLPASDTEAWQASHEQRRRQFEERVFPLLCADERERANDLFASVKFDFEPTVVHGDLGPDHVLCGDDGQINGVIDWTDARLGDPATWRGLCMAPTRLSRKQSPRRTARSPHGYTSALPSITGAVRGTRCSTDSRPTARTSWLADLPEFARVSNGKRRSAA
jgi:aminoglycoside phosphotransferase (APT) family kinase protein